MAFDDDPHDTGGRTCMGLRQDEYNPFRERAGLPCRDVWLIDDAEIEALYLAQYWTVVRGDDLPMGLDVAVFDMGVLCGVGTAAQKLQLALGTRVDSHIGEKTIAAARAVEDMSALIGRYMDLRRTYHRQCRTFRYHGANWLARCDVIQAIAIRQASPAISFVTTVETEAAAHDVPPSVPRTPKDPAPTSAAKDAQANTTVAGGALSFGGTFKAAFTLAQALISKAVTSITSAVLVVMSDPNLAQTALELVMCTSAMGGCVYLWLKRRRAIGNGVAA